MARIVRTTADTWPQIAEKLDPNRGIALDARSGRRAFLLYGEDKTTYRITAREVQNLMQTGKLPLWLVALLVEHDAVSI